VMGWIIEFIEVALSLQLLGRVFEVCQKILTPASISLLSVLHTG
jgi:hypothetical protein